ncbi:Helix-turn-helix domain-containing protein [Amycolatopsis pretoriensis]|uniref:Helix-turn-helix domain-containing protein n=2 Tax=Amycolatopsis pretoriensis TaxID=218821 RepID=A0A1H5QES4_9PSEU|nr:Helix-turn-helix domain-containing protein [Amycolatopsis pretoriensis]
MPGSATFGGELRRFRNDAGLSLAMLADRVHYSKDYLSKVENGVASPNETLAASCDDVRSAAAAALNVDDVDQAVLVLEQGRAIQIGRALDTSAALNRLRDDHPELAQEFDRLRRLLDHEERI